MEVPVNLIKVHDDRRNPRGVEQLAESIETLGLLNPITVMADKVMLNSTLTEGYRLVCGRSRLAAFILLERETIPAVVLTLNKIDLELAEIDENLIRSELTELERGEQLIRRERIFSAKGGKRIGTPGGEQKIGFDRDTADKTGTNKETIRKARRRVTKIDPLVMEAIRDNKAIADSGVELDALASMKPRHQVKAVEMVSAGEAKSIRKAKAQIVPRPTQKKRSNGRSAQQRNAHLWCQLRDCLVEISGMPLADHMVSLVPSVQRELVDLHLPAASRWLAEFEAAWAAREGLTDLSTGRQLSDG